MAGLTQIKSVKEKFVTAVRLAPPLRAEAKKDHMAFSVIHVERGDFAFQTIGAGEITAFKRRTVR